MKPILFSTPMVQAILEGRKTQTRREIKDPRVLDFLDALGNITPENHSKYKIGDILYVRETWQKRLTGRIAYKADFTETDLSVSRLILNRWKPSIHMPKAYARIFLKVTNVKVERLQDISDDDCSKEGIKENSNRYEMMLSQMDMSYPNSMVKGTAWHTMFSELWDSVSENGYKWNNNPYVFVYEFERADKPEVNNS
jgi:hypothetical protein